MTWSTSCRISSGTGPDEQPFPGRVDQVIEQDIAVSPDGCTLSGTLCLPDHDGRFPTVLMVHGSGPLDRNENVKSQKLDVFNVIAHALAEAGIASVRYDKRGCGQSTGDYFAAGHTDLVADAAYWVSELASHPSCDPADLYVLGHSEGAAIAPQLYLRHARVAGLVLVCPFLQDLDQVLLRQAQRVEKELFSGHGFRASLRRGFFRLLGVGVASQQKLIRRIKASTADTIRIRLHKLPARWFRELFELDLEPVFRQVECPVLVFGGAKDLQCDPEDVHRIAALCAGPVEAEVMPDLTHILRLEPNEPALTRSRLLSKHPVEPAVVSTITGWVERQVQRRG